MQTRPVPAAPNRFGIDSDTCELLLAFERASSLQALSAQLGRDVSVISRRLQQVARTHPVLEKRAGRWVLTHQGRRICDWAREAMSLQQEVLRERRTLTLATTREFGARVLAPALSSLLAEAEVHLSLLTTEDTVESMLLSGKADLGFDCGRPSDPGIRFRTVIDEGFVVVAAPRFLRAHRVKEAQALMALPHLQYRRLAAPTLLQLAAEVPHVYATFNDLASIRAACVAGLGWAVLPGYVVRPELAARALQSLKGWAIRPERFGVWWRAERSDLAPWIARAQQWLAQQDLS